VLAADDDPRAGRGERTPRTVAVPEREADLVVARGDDGLRESSADEPFDHGHATRRGRHHQLDVGAPAARGEHLAHVPTDATGMVDGVGEDADA
jgi:hypothetical protein